MKVTLLDSVIKYLKLPNYRPNFNKWTVKEKQKLATSLIESKNIQVFHKTLNYPYQQINKKAFVRKFNLHTSHDTSYLNIFKYLHLLRRRPLKDVTPITLPPRKTSTYQYKLSLKPRDKSLGIDLILFQSGLSKSIQEARHFIRLGFIILNGNVLKTTKYIPQDGDLIQNIHPTCLFSYFNQKYLSLLPKRSRKRRGRKLKSHTVRSKKVLKFYRFKFASQPSNVVSLNFNEVLYFSPL